MLTLKLTMLLALTSASRAHEIKYLNKDYMLRMDEKFVFRFGDVTKTAKPGKMKPAVEFKRFPYDSDLCVHSFLDLYFSKRESWGKGDGQMMVSYKSPHDPVSTSTISRWIVDILKLSGVDVSKFKGHSTRAATTSKALSLGISTKEILERGNWTRVSTFQKFYSKPIEGRAKDGFQEKILFLT
eukprot:TCONS_00052109-protein